MFVLTTAEMRAADAAAVAAGTPAEILMERAGGGAVAAIERHFGTQRGYRVHVVCGRGHNGGDGFVVARRLAERGAHVEVHLLAEAHELTGAAKVHFERLASSGATLVARAPLREPDLVVDAVLGTGARGAVPDTWAAALAGATESPVTRVVALDLPTGLDADRGRPLTERGFVQRADLTVTFAHLKPVHVLFPGRALCGAIEVVDIGVEPLPADEPLEFMTESLAAALVPRRRPEAHKGDAGRVLVVGGSAGLTGAVVLASMSALRAGAGLVTAAVPESVNDAIESAMIEAMTWPLPESPGRALAGSAGPMIVARAREAQVVALGPGLSRGPEPQELAWRVVADSPVPVVLDADGLNAFAGRAERLFAARRRAPLVVTPHLGELARLTGFTPAALEDARLDMARRYAEEWGAVLVMKGTPTVVASPTGAASVNPTGNPGMATAGMGDVLTGVIASFIAQGLAPYDAARLGVYVHGLAADLAHARVGTLGLVAGDVTAALPQAMHRLASAGPRSEVVPLPQTRIAPAPPDGIRSS
jgi:NAD(P)H-hydrate epimerase